MVVFERLTVEKRDFMRLSWIVGDTLAKACIDNGYVITQDDIVCSPSGVAAFKDDRCALKNLRGYFESRAWQVFQLAVEQADADDAVCNDCHTKHGRNGKLVKWVQCDSCLAWLHQACVGLTRKPKGHWFCTACDYDAATDIA